MWRPLNCEHLTLRASEISKGTFYGLEWEGILSACLFNLYAEYILQKGGLDETEAGIKITRGNTNNLRYVDDTTLMAESEEELKKLLVRVKEENEKAGLKLNIKKLRSWYSVP